MSLLLEDHNATGCCGRALHNDFARFQLRCPSAKMMSSPSASGVGEETMRQTPLIGRRYCQVPFTSTPGGASSSSFSVSQSVSQSSHDELVTRLRSALKALGGRPEVTPPASSNKSAVNDLEACSRRVEPVPKMQSLDTAADDQDSVDEDDETPSHVIEAHVALKSEAYHLKKDAGVLRAEIDELNVQRVALGSVEDDLRTRRSELAEMEAAIKVSEHRLHELEGELAAKRGDLDAHASHLDCLERLASDGEKIVEDQSRKASAALNDLECMEAELGRLSAELVEVTARLDEKSRILREAETLVSRSKQRAVELEGQELLLEELERHNAAALDESRRLGREIDRLQRQKQAVSFSLEPALNDALLELERSKVFSSKELARERGKVEQLERALQRKTANHSSTGDIGGMGGGSEKAGDLVHALECERLASVKRTTALAEGGCGWRRWRPSATWSSKAISAYRNAAAC